MTLLPLSSLPAVNASLNAACTVFLLLGYACIRSGKIRWHRFCMVAAFCCSTVFLGFYLYFHARAGVIRFGGRAGFGPFISRCSFLHTTLAVVIVPLVLITLTRALRERFDKHRAIARWTLPLWLYVSSNT